jgi:glycerophosphoryl diester phosphodiesterase
MIHPHPGRPLNCAHRGACKIAPENTLAAFSRAIDLGAEATELDAQLTADGALVACHNLAVDTTSNGHGRVAAMTLAELKALDFGGWYAPEFAGERIPTLDEVFDLAGERLLVNVELKTVRADGDAELARAAAALFARRNLYDRAMVSSFNPFVLMRVHALDPRIELGLLGARKYSLRAASWLRPFVRVQALHPDHTLVDARYMAWARQRGYRVNVWTVNEEAGMRRMIDLGVDMLITDVPDRLRAVLG